MTQRTSTQGTRISWMPRWLPESAVTYFETPSRTPLRCARPSDDGWAALGEGLRSAHERLREIPIAEIVRAIDVVAERWGDRTFAPRVQSRSEVVRATGFSEEAVDRSFDVELRNYRADSLWRVLRRELGDPEVLDGFRPDAHLEGSSFALGPRVTLTVLTGNVPGLPALSLVRSLLVKSAVIAKVASGEPTFAARFVETLAEVDPRLGEAIAITYWKRDDEASLEAALEQVDAVIAYGSEAACSAVRARVRPHQRYVEHGHKLSVEIVSKRYLEELGAREVARRIAEDVSTFNQHACIAPQAVLVESDDDAHAFASELARAMDEYARECPLGEVDEADAASLQLRRLTDAWTAATNPRCGFWKAASLDWTVTLGTSLQGITGAGNRAVRVVAAPNLARALALVRPIARYLQNVGLGATGREFWTTAEALARLGACRVSEPGNMARPSMIWKHDGMSCVAELLRWCDVEMHREGNRRDRFESKETT